MEKTEASDRLLCAARALLARGEANFTVAAVCAEAGLDRKAFREQFANRAALMAALMEQGAETGQGPAVAATDAWLERRLRVFERALNTLEIQAEARAREQARAIAALEEKLFALGQGSSPPSPGKFVEKRAAGESAADDVTAPLMEAIKAEAAPDETDAGQLELLPLAPQPVSTISRAEMADVLQSARGKVRPVPEEARPSTGARLRWLAIGVLSLVALFLCIGLTLGGPARATQERADGIAHRQVAQGELGRAIALADAGDAGAQTRLALAYLRGAGVARDAGAAARWSEAAAGKGQPVAQYVLGTLYNQGEGVKPDPARAFGLFAAAAARGNLKAMHNLAIAYAEGLGTARDESKAAEWFERAAQRGYVDSAFDLGVLYERGQGVRQDPARALAWYAIAARAGDAASAARAELLRQQLTAAQVQPAEQAALAFAPLTPPAAANILPSL